MIDKNCSFFYVLLSLVFLGVNSSTLHFENMEDSRNLQSVSCSNKNRYPVFYGGVNHDFVRYTDASSDGRYIVMCGESYTSTNFVDRPIQAYLMLINAADGTYIWGKYF